MSKKTVSEWKEEVAEKHHTSTLYVVPENSFAARGYIKTGRIVLGYEKSPFGGRYVVYGCLTRSEVTKRNREGLSQSEAIMQTLELIK